MHPADLRPVAPADRTQTPLDLFLVFAGANIVATTFQVGATLSGRLSLPHAMAIIAIGSVFGGALVALLAPVGSRRGVPSIVATRAALGMRGAHLVAILLFATNFAWIALNNVIAASVAARALPVIDARGWALVLGLLATAVVAGGPRAVSRADRIAVPLMAVAGLLVTLAVLRLPWRDAHAQVEYTSRAWVGGFDVVVGYQVSWLLMFADYPRYTANARRGALAVFLGLTLAALWFMPLGFVAAGLAASADPGAMVTVVGLGAWGALLLALATLTTNFVNIYMSALALKSLRPATGEQIAVWGIGLIGTALGLFSGVWLESFGAFMMLIGGTLVPVGGILLAHFVLLRRYPAVGDLYASPGPYTRRAGFMPAGVTAWLAGSVVYYWSGEIGATLPTLLVSIVVYLVVFRSTARST